jgi:hypothetical protein
MEIYAMALGWTRWEVHLITRLSKGFGYHCYRRQVTTESQRWAMNRFGWGVLQTQVAAQFGIADLPQTPSYLCRYCPRHPTCQGALYEN